MDTCPLTSTFLQLFYLRKSAHKIKRGTSLDKKVATEKLNSSQVVPKKKVDPLIRSPLRTKPLAPLTEKNTRERRARSKTRIGNYHLKVDIFNPRGAHNMETGV